MAPFRGLACLLLLALLGSIAGCATGRPPRTAGNALAHTAGNALGFRAGPPVRSLPGWDAADLGASLAAFLRSCPRLTQRADATGLTSSADWSSVCRAARAAGDPARFFAEQFATVVAGSGEGLATGYFEPELAAALAPSAAYPVPIYRRPPDLVEKDVVEKDLVEKDLGRADPLLPGQRLVGRLDGRAFRPFYTRAEIEDGALAGRGLELAYAADPISFFFLQVQGSGRLRLPDGRVLRIGYDGRNGHAYVAVGRRLREMGALPPDGVSMDSIAAWMRRQPDRGRALMRENPSYVFFRELTGPGPIGALGIEVTPEVTVAADPAFVPLGAPLWVETLVSEPGAADPTPFRRLMLAQDTGSAIKGQNRLDLFWGSGARARAIAGSLAAPARVTLLLPRTAVQRLVAADAPHRS